MTAELLPSAVDAIGNTPLVELSRLTRGEGGRIFAKLEYLSPGFSKKDRIARQILQEAEATGALKPGQPVIVGSSRVDLQACKLEYSIVSPK